MTQQNDKMVLKVLRMECKTFRIYVYILSHTLTLTYENKVARYFTTSKYFHKTLFYLLWEQTEKK